MGRCSREENVFESRLFTIFFGFLIKHFRILKMLTHLTKETPSLPFNEMIYTQVLSFLKQNKTKQNIRFRLFADYSRC